MACLNMCLHICTLLEAFGIITLTAECIVIGVANTCIKHVEERIDLNVIIIYHPLKTTNLFL